MTGSSRPTAARWRSMTGMRSGFTLFEIALSLMLLTFSVLTVLVVLPTGIRMQQQSRFELLASTNALQTVEFFAGKNNCERIADFETPLPWAARPFCYTSTRWDMESRISRWDSGVMPVPLNIAQRLDSPNDEIANLLSQGAYLYYADPRTMPTIDQQYINPSAPSESQKLVFAVSGYAQNNAIPIFSYKAWPYRAAYPSPPLFSVFNGNQFKPMIPSTYSSPIDGGGNNVSCTEGWANGLAAAQLPSVRDPFMDGIFQQVAALEENDPNFFGGPPPPSPASIQPFQASLQTAVLAFCKDKFSRMTNPLGALPVSGLAPQGEYSAYYLPPSGSDFVALGAQYDADFNGICQQAEQQPNEGYNPSKATERAEIALRVQCMRFMAFLMSTYYSYVQGSGTQPDVTQIQFNGSPLSLNQLRYYHDRCKQFAMRYAASFPYDWGAPRPLTRCIMMDYPLIEYDLFSPPVTGNIATSPVTPAAQWAPISAQAITSIGMPATCPGVITPSNTFDPSSSPFVPYDTRAAGQPLWGDASHFTLTKPFAAAERCRQLVFWSVDWQSYTDAETAPSAPMDASRCPLYGLDNNNITWNYMWLLDPGLPIQDALFVRNPERDLNFISSMTGVPTGTNVTNSMINGNGNDGGNMNILNGIYGADRNHNYLLDRGPVPTSVRLHATVVARFNFYDPRLPETLR